MTSINLNWYLVVVLTVVAIAFIFDRQRLMKQLKELNRYYIISMANPDTILGLGIISSLQRGDELDAIIDQIRMADVDNEDSVEVVYGEYYSQLKELL